MTHIVTQPQPEGFYCTKCGSDEMIAEAFCYWDITTQKWAHFEAKEDGWDSCADCGNAQGEFRPITDVKTLAQIAISKQEELQ